MPAMFVRLWRSSAPRTRNDRPTACAGLTDAHSLNTSRSLAPPRWPMAYGAPQGGTRALRGSAVPLARDRRR
eukprot:314461-Prymnesium_polylepis.1